MRHLTNVLLFTLFVLSLGFAQSDVILPSDNLVVDGIPPIPKAIADAVGRYTEFRSAGFQSWHPTKREMLISTRFGDTPQIHHVKMPGGARTQLTFFVDRVGGARFNPKRDDYIILSKDVGGGEWFQLYRYDVATGAISLLTDGGRSQNSLGTWSSAGDRIAYASTRRNGKDRDIYVMDPTNPGTNKLVLQVEGGGWGAIDWSPDDKSLLVGEYVSINESYLHLVDLATGSKTLLTPKGKEQVAYGGAEFSPDGKGIYLTTDLNSEFQRLAYFDLATKKYKFLTEHIQWDVDNFEVSPDGTMIAFVTNEDGIGVLRILDTQTGKELPAPKLPNGVIGGISWHPQIVELAFTLSTAKSPSDVYSYNPKTGTVERWTFSETGGILTDNFPEAQLIKWKSFDGKMISGFLYRPPSRFTGKRPVIVNIHGGPESQARPGFLARNNYYLNEMGIAMIFPNIRGSSGYGKTFLKLDNGFLREDSYKDLAALLDWIKQQPDLDGDRILVTGGSYGGHATLAVATFYSDKIRCAVDVVGMSNLVTFLQNTESYRRDLRRVEYGDERDPKMKAYLEKIAPLNNVEKVKKPLFVIQGKNDPRVPWTESEQIVKSLKARSVPVWYLLANDEGHGFAKKKNQDYQFYTTVMFIQKFLLDTAS
ncbi:MAG TPA: prolyl oligopeptidase family serine peptidase [Bacteroidota bacterium]|nr:prolyl oligopeptidase family serine peptidase [Bacteroidota bacterium]